MPSLRAPRPHAAWLFVLVMVLSALALSGCDLLPQTATEWTVALVIAGVLVVGVAVMAWITSRQSKKK